MSKGITMHILDKTDEGKYLVEYKLESDLWEKEIDFRELKAEIKGGVNKIYFDIPFVLYDVDVDLPDDEYPDYSVNLFKYVYYREEKEYVDVDNKEYKRKSDAIAQMKRWYKEYDYEMFKYFHEFEQYIESL